MTGPAPTEIQKIPTGRNTKTVHLPTQELKWREGVVAHTQKIDPSFSVEHATPPAAQPIPDSDALKQVKAERIGAESGLPFSGADIEHNLKTIGTIFGGEEPSTHTRTIPGGKVISLMKKRAQRLFRGSRTQPAERAA